MSKYIAQIPLDAIDHISIIEGRGRTLAQLKGNADYIINGGFYDMVIGRATGHLKVDGMVIACEEWNCWGLRWDNGPDIRMDVVPDSGGRNYISGVELLTPTIGLGGKLSYPAEVGGIRGRTAMAILGDKLVLYCSGDGTKDAKTPEALRDELAAMGATAAIMLDGGGSSQCDFRGVKISSTRRVHNYIAVWLKREEKEEHKNEEVDLSVMKKVVLDPGHGVETAGKRSPDGKHLEHEFNLDIAKRVKGHLERHGVIAVLTRSGENDVDLEDRVKLANEIKPDLVTSFHSNASGNGEEWTDPSGYGIYTSAGGANAERNKAAKAILARVSAAGIQLWGDGLFHEGFYVLKNTVAPAVLIEHGFHTNINEVELLKTDVYRALLAKVDAQGILDYLGIPWQEEAVEKPAEGCLTCPHCGGKLIITKG